MCLRRGESEDRLERRNRAKGHLDIDLEEFDRRRSYFFAYGKPPARPPRAGSHYVFKIRFVRDIARDIVRDIPPQVRPCRLPPRQHLCLPRFYPEFHLG